MDNHLMDLKQQTCIILRTLMNDYIRIESIEVVNPLNKTIQPDGTVIRDTNEINITIRAYKDNKLKD